MGNLVTASLIDGIGLRNPDNTINGISAWYAPNCTKAIGAVCSAAVMMDDGSYSIIYDDLFNGISDKAKEYVIAHELGHIENKDKTMTSKELLVYLLACNLWVPKIEFKADLKAAKRMGFKKCLAGMREFSKSLGISGQIQLYRRIVALTAHYIIKEVV